MPQIRKKAEQSVFLRTHGWQSRSQKAAVPSSSAIDTGNQSSSIQNTGKPGGELDHQDQTGRKGPASEHEDEPNELTSSLHALEASSSPTSESKIKCEGPVESRKEAIAETLAKEFGNSTAGNYTALKGSAILAVLPDGSVSGGTCNKGAFKESQFFKTQSPH